MVTFHQVTVSSIDNLSFIDLVKELTNLYRFFCGFGKIVDFNLENFPKSINISFTKHTSVVGLLEKGMYEINSEFVTYLSPTGAKYRLKARKVDYKLPVRNIKDGSKSAYENYMPEFIKNI
jgi:hypothetical protein